MYQLNKKRQAPWVARIKWEDLQSRNYFHTYVRSDHFVTGKPSQLYETSHQDWTPSQNLAVQVWKDAVTVKEQQGHLEEQLGRELELKWSHAKRK